MAAPISNEEQAFMTELGKRISLLRKERELTQAQVAHSLNVSQQAVQSWEAGRRRIQISILPAVAGIFQVSLEELLKDGERKTGRKRGPSSRLEQQFQQIGQLPKAKQKLVSEMLDAVIMQAQQTRSDG
ncbi:TPA_asm: helix-turn-helix transcriptional regulator [Salmonella enterica subsp. houtenae serovar 45:g,z51:-]|uniref:Helix-turn-helix transcriptional regulator n=1 Tax=Salmonella enterica subsp. houtenae serovar 45:g,z51:- TaxID=1967611 RepID=A0A736R838_SALHO|nr:helix-turn-helix transcriptional regulator [Salmonella enterica subsp. houtenae str. CFSAN000557]HAE7767705.1 helix-turn-helix transcriptional regulator [Salmonella enterica subsp. houtenae serovar 45:g,z51:-]